MHSLHSPSLTHILTHFIVLHGYLVSLSHASCINIASPSRFSRFVHILPHFHASCIYQLVHILHHFHASWMYRLTIYFLTLTLHGCITSLSRFIFALPHSRYIASPSHSHNILPRPHTLTIYCLTLTLSRYIASPSHCHDILPHPHTVTIYCLTLTLTRYI